MAFELATPLMFLNVNLRFIFSTLPLLVSHVSSPAPTNNILVTYGALQVLYCIVLYCIVGRPTARALALQTTTDADRRQRAEQYRPIRRSTNIVIFPS